MDKLTSLLLLFGLSSLTAATQVSNADVALIQKLDSVTNSPSVSRHFAGLYLTTTEKAVDFFQNCSKQEKNFIQRFETRFAFFFLHSAEAYYQGIAVPAEWKTYFADSSLLPIQYKLLGINAHINGDIWQALTAEFSLKEIREGRESYFKFQKGLAEEYRNFYSKSFNSSAKVRFLHSATEGLDKTYGKLMLARWRKRQMRLAILYYTNRDKFNIKLIKLHQKMRHINYMILQYL